MRWSWLWAAATLAALASAAHADGVTATVRSGRVVFYTSSEGTRKQLEGTARITNGLSQPLDGVVLTATLYGRQLAAPPGRPEPAPAVTGSASQQLWLGAPLAPGASQEVALAMVTTASYAESIELTTTAVQTGLRKVRLISGPVHAVEGIQVTAQPTEAEAWLHRTFDIPPLLSLGVHADQVTLELANDGTGPLSALTVWAVLPSGASQALELPLHTEAVLPGERATKSQRLDVLIAVPPGTTLGDEIALPLEARDLELEVEPRAVIVQKASAIIATRIRGTTLGKVKKGARVTELRDAVLGWVLVRTADGLRGYLHEKVLRVALKTVKGKRVKDGFFRQTDSGRYIELCPDVRRALGLGLGARLATAEVTLQTAYRRAVSRMTTPDGERVITLDPVPYGRVGSCPILHESSLYQVFALTID